MTVEIKWKDREVENPVLRVVLGVGAAVAASAMLVWAVLALTVAMIGLVAICVASLPVHAVLRARGRRGFWHDGVYSVGREGFRR